MIVMCSLVLLTLNVCKYHTNTVFSNANFKPSELQDNFKNWHGEADVSCHGVKSLKAKRIRFQSLRTFQK